VRGSSEHGSVTSRRGTAGLGGRPRRRMPHSLSGGLSVLIPGDYDYYGMVGPFLFNICRLPCHPCLRGLTAWIDETSVIVRSLPGGGGGEAKAHRTPQSSLRSVYELPTLQRKIRRKPALNIPSTVFPGAHPRFILVTRYCNT